MTKLPKIILVVASSALYCGYLQAMPGGNGVVPKLNWADSYSVDGRCYIDSNFDHGIGSEVVSTPIGNQTVRQVANKLGSGPGRAGNPVYNDVQCGNGPANNAGDEDFDQCPGRVDLGASGCSVIGPRWDLAAAYDQPEPQSDPPITKPENPQQENPEPTSACYVTKTNLGVARRAFAEACPTADFRDCDPIKGQWVCADVKVETLNPDQLGTNPMAPVTNPDEQNGDTPVATPPTASDVCYSVAATLQAAKQAYAGQCAAERADCDPVNGVWVCASKAVETIANLDTGESAVPPAPEPVPPQPQPEEPEVPAGPDTPVSDSVKDARNLLSLHYDCAPDRDDGHANVAGKVLADVFNIKPHVVVGAYGYKQRGAYNDGCEPIFDAAWRSGTALDSGYVNAFQDRNGAVEVTVNLWKRTLQAGGQVFVAEGGPSDFTYEVLLKLNSDERGRVTVVQHSVWNQDQTQPSNLNYVRDNTNYIKIDDGNGGGATADLNQRSSSFVTRALNSRWQVAWSEAFAFLSPDERLDFSDTVEVLYLLDVPKAVVATPDDFADRYFR